MVQVLRKKCPYLAANLDQVILHQNNAPAHTSQTTQLELDLLGFECLKHPPYSPDLAPMDFAVFPNNKSFLRGQRFDDLPELRQEVMNIILNMKTEQFEKIFDDWLKRCKKCVERGLRRENLLLLLLTSLNVRNFSRALGVSFY